MYRTAALLISLLLLMPLAHTAPPRQANIPYVLAAPAIDGKLGDPVWKKAAVLDGFTQAGMGRKEETPRPVTRATTVRVCYSATALYLAVEAHEPNMAKLNRGVPDEGYPDAPLEWTGDVIELFVHPNPQSPQVFHLAFNPNGARWDWAKLQGTGWNGNWRVVSQVLGDRFVAEVEIPFADLGGPGELAATPAPGASWRANVCRVAKPVGEFSTWSYSPTNFLNTGAFGEWRFAAAGRPPVTVNSLEPGELLAGRSHVSLGLTATAPVKLEAVLAVEPVVFGPERHLTEILRRPLDLAAGAPLTADLPYDLKASGDLRLLVTLLQDRNPVYQAGVSFTVFPILDSLTQAETDLSAASQVAGQALTALKRPDLEAEVRALADARKQLAALRTTLDQDGPSPELIDRTRAFLTQTLRPRLLAKAHLVRPLAWLHDHGLPAADLAVGTAPAGDKRFADEPFQGPLVDRVAISLAGNELQSTQLVLLPVGPTARQAVTLTAGDLRHGDATLPASAVSFHRVGTVTLKPSPVGSRGGDWPDPLYPATGVTLGDAPQAVLLTIAAPFGQTPGDYTGSLTFTGADGKQLAALPLTVTVYPFSLPKRLHYMVDFWLSEHHVRAYLGDLTPERFATMMDVMGPYHFASLPGYVTMRRHIKIVLEPDGDLSFDFSGLDPYFETAVRHGLAGVNLSFTNNYGAITGSFKTVTATRRATGETVQILVDDPDKLAGHYLASLYRYVLDKGWYTADHLYCDVADEPWTPQAKEQVRQLAAKVHAAVPQLKCYAAGTFPGEGLDEALQTWVPQIRQFKPEDYTPADELWWYQCLYKAPITTFTINRPATELRTLGWLCWKYRVTGFLYWSSIYWGTSNDYSKWAQRPPESRPVQPGWPVPFDGTDFPGDALFFYPTADSVIPNLRSLDFRDGVDEWEYLYRLDWLAKEAAKRHLALPDGAAELLAVPATIAESPRAYTHDAALLDRTRERVAAAITALQKQMPDLGDPP